MDNFDLKKFLTENQLTSTSRTNVLEASRSLLDHPSEQEREILKLRETLPVIDLGETNGWDQKMNNLHTALIEFETSNDSDKSIIINLNSQGTYKEISQVVAIPRRRYNIVYRVDSSD